MKAILSRLIGGATLSSDEAEAALGQIMDGAATPAQIAAFLVALRLKGETTDEIVGLARAMRAKSVRVLTHRSPLVDTCGTGGDSVKTFNISTAAAFVVSAAGAAVAKHGNRAVTSKSGSADVLEALGVDITLDAAAVGHCIDTLGVGFLFARSHHPAMRFVAPVRAELGVRTVFNALGPLTNPAQATRQVIGVYDASLVEPLAHVLLALGAEHALVVHGLAGLDEIATFGETLVAEARDGVVQTYTLTAAALGLSEATPESVAPGVDAFENGSLLAAVLHNDEHGPRREIVCANAAAALYVAGLADSLKDGVALADATISSYAAIQKLDALIALTQSLEGTTEP